MSYAGGYGSYGLESISVSPTTGAVTVPVTRMRDAAQVQDFGRRLWQNDEKRSIKRSKLNGLVGGFPPFRVSKMRDAGMAQGCNANFGTAASYMENASGAFYDLSSEAPGIVNIQTSHGEDDERDEYSRIMSEEADRIIGANALWDYEMQRSQWEMTLHGCGPLIWEDCYRVFPRATSCGDFKVPERTRSDVEYYEVAWADVDYYPPQLYEFIKDHEFAERAGWDVDFTQRVIANAMDIRQPENRAYDFEFYQQEIKNNSLSYYDDSKVCHLGFCWIKEFNGRVTQVIVEREAETPAGDMMKEGNTEKRSIKFLFKHVGRYDDFKQAVAPMYFDRGNGGYHHSVTGMSKMYSPMEFENRLLCRLMDGAFAPKVLFKPSSGEAAQKMQLSVMGHHGVLPAGWDAIQSPISGFINEGLAMYQASSQLMHSNLSNYRQQVEPQTKGNPETKFGRQLDAYQASALNKTTYNRYYRQLDSLYGEIVRRLCDLNNTSDENSKLYKERCRQRGVPDECFGRLKSVEAVRVVGEGSAFLRKSTLGEMFQSGLVQGLPEEGQQNWRNDYIAAMAGQKSVLRYNPPKKRSKLPSDQYASAMMQVAGMKIGVPPIMTSSQNALTYAGVFLTSAVQAVQSVRQGGDPVEVLQFVDLAAPAVHAHLQRIANDPIRKPAVMHMEEQLQQLGKIVDRLRKMVQEQRKKQAQQRQKTQEAMTDEQIATRKLLGDEKRKDVKLAHQMQRDSVKTRQQLAIADATAASNIERQNRIAAFSD